MLAASDMVRSHLHPDSDPELYFDSIRQWAIWTHEQDYNQAQFTEAFTRHTRQNVEAAGQRWTTAIEAQVRERAPYRFADVRRALAAARLR
jgi:hypothetical protein